MHTDLRRTGWFDCSDARLNRLHDAADWSFRTNACDIPTDCPATRARGLDRRLADLCADRRVPLRRRRLLDEVVARPRRRSARRRRGPELRTRSGAAGAEDNTVKTFLEGFCRLGRRRGPRAVGDVASLRRQVAARGAVAEHGRMGRLPGRRSRASHRHPQPRRAQRDRRRRTSSTCGTPGITGASGASPTTPATTTSRTSAPTRPSSRPPTSRTQRRRSPRSQRCSAGPRTRIGTASWRGQRDRRVAHRVRRRRRQPSEASGRPITSARWRSTSFPTESARARRAADWSSSCGAPDNHLNTGFLGTPYLLPVLADAGHLDVAYDLLFQETPPSWLAMIDRGATTIWEDWDGIDATGRSARVAEPLQQGRGRSRSCTSTSPASSCSTTDPGYRHFRIAPLPGGGITSAEAAHDSPYGRIESSWTIVGDELRLVVTCPTEHDRGRRAPERYGPARSHARDDGLHRRRVDDAAVTSTPTAAALTQAVLDEEALRLAEQAARPKRACSPTTSCPASATTR